MAPDQAKALAARLDGWEVRGPAIERLFRFPDYYRVQAFVNAVMWIAHREDHHPDLEVSWGSVRVTYTTHAIGGLSENDFLCAAKVDALVTSPTG
jgi:4a-hydroxytetrahydrobiopterin dehydratase